MLPPTPWPDAFIRHLIATGALVPPPPGSGGGGTIHWSVALILATVIAGAMVGAFLWGVYGP